MHHVMLMIATTLFAAAPARLTAEQQVLAAEQEWVDVTLAGDADKFASFIGDEYVALTSHGKTFDKASWVSDIRSAKTKYESVKLSNLVVRVYGNTAVVRVHGPIGVRPSIFPLF